MSQEQKTRLNLCLPSLTVEGLQKEQEKRNGVKITTLCRILIRERLEELKGLELNAAK